MDEQTLARLRARYADAKPGEVFDPRYAAVARTQFREGGRRRWPFEGPASLLMAPLDETAQAKPDLGALDIALFLESDRMGYLLDVVTPQLVDSQRDVVKNERRQRYENAPYGMAFIRIYERLYPKGHPYSWPGIGYMEETWTARYFRDSRLLSIGGGADEVMLRIIAQLEGIGSA